MRDFTGRSTIHILLKDAPDYLRLGFYDEAIAAVARNGDAAQPPKSCTRVECDHVVVL
jgi:hypothetical protein